MAACSIPPLILVDSTDSFRYDPVADSIITIASIPRATAETRALNLNGQMWVMGGGRTAPNPSNEVDIYDPGTNSWSIGTPFVTARRNFPTDTDGLPHLAGRRLCSYDTNGLDGNLLLRRRNTNANANGDSYAYLHARRYTWAVDARGSLPAHHRITSGHQRWHVRVLSIAGQHRRADSTPFTEYDLTTNVWTPLASMLTGSYDTGIAYARTRRQWKDLCVRRARPNFFVLTTTQIYDIATNSWSMGRPCQMLLVGITRAQCYTRATARFT